MAAPEMWLLSERLSAHPQMAESDVVVREQQAMPRIVLWPESPNSYATSQPDFTSSLSAFVRQMGVPAIVGATGVSADPLSTPPYRVYNSAALFTPERGYVGRYDKIHLVPFGEFVPYASLFSFASGLTREVGTVERGQLRRPMLAGGHRYGVFICYESIFGDEIRQLVRAVRTFWLTCRTMAGMATQARPFNTSTWPGCEPLRTGGGSCAIPTLALPRPSIRTAAWWSGQRGTREQQFRCTSTTRVNKRFTRSGVTCLLMDVRRSPLSYCCWSSNRTIDRVTLAMGKLEGC